MYTLIEYKIFWTILEHNTKLLGTHTNSRKHFEQIFDINLIGSNMII